MRIVTSFYSSLTGNDYDFIQLYPWKQQCQYFVKNNLLNLMASIYVRKFFNVEKKKLTLELIEGIRMEFQKLLNTSSWMDEETRKMALKKLENIDAMVAYPDELLDDEVLANYYENLTITDNFFENCLELGKFENWNSFKNVYYTEIDKMLWEMHSYIFVVNAFYLQVDNNISKRNFDFLG